MISCPVECINPDKICGPQPDFLDKHGTFILTFVGAISACSGIVLTYFLKSRCKRVKCGCIELDRNVVNLEASQIEIQNPN
tara:strand:- start:874 stop:1116 length:243 start_codon:yes stop_codon:yes gene_type:complete